jgi:hypothetical protein
MAVKTCGATAPAVARKVYELLHSGGELAGIYNKLKKIFDRLHDVYDDISVVIKHVGQMVSLSQAVIGELRHRKLAGLFGNVEMHTGAMSPDVHNASVGWRLFGFEVADMEDAFKEHDVDGKREYFAVLKALVIAGDSAIRAKTNIIVRADQLATAMVQDKMERRNHDRLHRMAYTSSTDEAVFGPLPRAMFDRLLQIRTMVYSDFSTYVDAYHYHTLLSQRVITLSPVKPIVDYLEDAARLQAAVVAFGSRALVQPRRFRMRTLAGFDSAAGLAAERCYLDGARTSEEGQTVALELQMADHFFDRDLVVVDRVDGEGREEAASATATTTTTEMVVSRCFLGDARRVLFEYVPGGRTDGADGGSGPDIVCDGRFGRLLDYTKHTPMTTWGVRLARSSSSSSSGLDLSGLKTIEVEFHCDVLWMGAEAAGKEESIWG